MDRGLFQHCRELTTYLPLVLRELRVAGRKPAAYRLRMTAAGAAMGICCWSLLVWSGWRGGAAAGDLLFQLLSRIVMGGCALAGLFLTVDSISRERREQTLELLFLTDLRTHDVVLGKLAAKAVVPFYALLATIPALSVSIFLGGVKGGEMWRITLVAANALFVSLASGLFASSLCTSQRSAHVLMFLTTLALYGWLPLSEFGPPPVLAPLSFSVGALFSPLTSYLGVADVIYRLEPLRFWGSLVVSHLAGWSLLAAACFAVRRSLNPRLKINKEPGAATGQPAGKNIRRASKLRQRLAMRHPVEWLVNRHALSVPLTGTSLALAAGAAAALSPDAFAVGYGTLLAAFLFGVHVAVKIWIAGDACRAFAADKNTGALESFLSTPLGANEILRAMRMGLLRRFAWVIVLLAMLDVAVACRFLSDTNTQVFLAILFGAALFVFECHCIAGIGLFRALVDPNGTLATLATLWRIQGMPYLSLALMAGLFRASSFGSLLAVGAVLCFGIDWLFVSNAKAGFLEHFRTLALRPYGQKAPLIESPWSALNWSEEERNPS